MINLKVFLKNLFKKKEDPQKLRLLEQYNNGFYLRVDGKTDNKKLLEGLKEKN